MSLANIIEGLDKIVRPLTTLAFVGTLVVGFMVGKLQFTDIKEIATTVILFWFIQRSLQSQAQEASPKPPEKP